MSDAPPDGLRTYSRIALKDARILAVAAFGGTSCALIGIPAPWLTGAMLAAAFAISGLGWRAPSRPIVDVAMLLCGLLLGSTATPEALAAMAHYPGSIALLLMSIAAIMLITGGYLVLVPKWPRMDAALAAAPGALSAVMAIALDKGAPLPRIVIIQLFRLFALIAAVPSLVVYSGIAPGDLKPITSAIATPQGLLVLGIAGVVTALSFEKLGITAPVILGATLASAVLHGMGAVVGTLPPEVAILSFVLLGAGIGGRFAGVTPRDLVAAMPVAFIAFLSSMLVAMAFAWPASMVAGVPYGTAFVAFAPGGLEAMAVLAFALGLDPLYVGAHHLVRFMAVGFGLPILIALISRGEKRQP
ncbi:MAG: AbrB family transcriptional regulator [Bosea sp. (in: a-proteobacteria)]